MSTDDNSRQVISMKEEIDAVKKALSDFSSRNFDKAYAVFQGLHLGTETHPRSRGYKFMTDYTKILITKGVPENGHGSFEIISK